MRTDPEPSVESQSTATDAARRAGDVVTAAMAAYERGDLEAMARFVHPDAEIEIMALGGEVVHGPDGLRAGLAGAAGRMHRPTKTTVEPLADDAAMMIGRVQYGDPSGGHWDSPGVWLSIVRDGKIWRTKAFPSIDEARAWYAGLSDARDGTGA